MKSSFSIPSAFFVLALSTSFLVTVAHAREDFPQKEGWPERGAALSVITGYLQPCPTSECTDKLQPVCDQEKLESLKAYDAFTTNDPRFQAAKFGIDVTAKFRGPIGDPRYHNLVGVYCDALFEVQSTELELVHSFSRPFTGHQKCEELLAKTKTLRKVVYGSISDIPGGFLQPKTCIVHVVEIAPKIAK